VLAPSRLYRVCARPIAPPVDDPDAPLAVAQRLASRLVVGWALLRVGVCAAKGLDIEGFIAVVIVVTTVQSLVRGPQRGSTPEV